MSNSGNPFFKYTLEKAKEFFSSREKVLKTLDSAMKKSIYLDNEWDELTGLTDKIKLFILMIRSYINGEYRDIPVKSIILILAGLIYFVNPFDLIGDFLPGIGYVDDVTVILLILQSVEEDVLRFKKIFYP